MIKRLTAGLLLSSAYVFAKDESCEEADFSCTFYEETNFGGKNPLTKCIAKSGNGKLEESLSEKFKSWKCGKNVRYEFCNKDQEDCSSGAGHARSSDSQDSAGNKVKSEYLKMSSYEVTEQGAVTVFSGSDCKGPFKSFDSSGSKYSVITD